MKKEKRKNGFQGEDNLVMTSSNEGCLVASDGSLAAAMKAPWRLLGGVKP